MAPRRKTMARSDVRLFLDTGFVLARFNPRDQFHEAARQLNAVLAACHELWTTDAVLLEIGAAFRQAEQRDIAVRLWDQFHSDNPRYPCCEAAGAHMQQAMDLFRSRTDKSWSLTDCLSFIVMDEQDITDALTPDHHFVQAGFRALMLEV
jgi:predicted nucleic acid-binding protein